MRNLLSKGVLRLDYISSDALVLLPRLRRTTALAAIVAQAPEARVLICGSLYLAGRVLRENG